MWRLTLLTHGHLGGCYEVLSVVVTSFPWVIAMLPFDFPQAHICQVLVQEKRASGVRQNKSLWQLQ